MKTYTVQQVIDLVNGLAKPYEGLVDDFDKGAIQLAADVQEKLEKELR